jgi:hypothetical protein
MDASEPTRLTAVVAPDGWTVCPSCGRRFAVSDVSRWNAGRHTTCGADLMLTGATPPFSRDVPGRPSPRSGAQVPLFNWSAFSIVFGATMGYLYFFPIHPNASPAYLVVLFTACAVGFGFLRGRLFKD